MIWILVQKWSRKALETPFQLVNRWGFVLLLDEAEQVFYLFKVLGIPAERDHVSSFRLRVEQDLKSNPVVSFFLRVLDYFFFNGHSVGTFDPVSQTRIHMKFFYPKLDLKTTLKIGAMSIDRTQRMWAENPETALEEHGKIIYFVEEHHKDSENQETTWNGRQVRNAFQTAVALAGYELPQRTKEIQDEGESCTQS